jgi:hypothetical protein
MLLTSPYSENKALLINGIYFPSKLRRSISLLGPSSPIRALIKTLVSITTASAISKMIAYTLSLTSMANEQARLVTPYTKDIPIFIKRISATIRKWRFYQND